MKRIDKILSFVQEYTEALTETDYQASSVGISAVDISEQTDLFRNNVSQDLNELHRKRKIIKLKGRPVKYLYLPAVESYLGGTIASKDLLFQKFSEISDCLTPAATMEDAFSSLIGWKGSLGKAIQTAKAAILYPPDGLHTLLLGESGVGKSIFAEVMYSFGQEKNIFAKDSPFIRFNCADYANNPQLLMTQLFGAVKGAYTGADEEKMGMVEAADGGVLFLDEIHRLPPEGQEMLFHFIDKKVYRRMGETIEERSADVFIIGATTETENNNLLTTFLRRIPTTIWLPNLEERGLTERLDIIREYASIEARKVNTTIELSKGALIQLLSYEAKGNLGQLRSDLQLAIARAYLESKQQEVSVVQVNSPSLPSYIFQLIHQSDQEKRNQLERIVPQKMTITADESTHSESSIIMDHDFVNYYFNQLIVSKEQIDLSEVFKDYTNKISKNMILQSNYSVLFDEMTKEISVILSDVLVKEHELVLDQSIYLALALFLRNLQEKNDLPHELIDVATYVPSVHSINTAKKMIQIIERRFHLFCSPRELQTLASIIDSLTKNKTQTTTHFMVVAHGTSAGASIAETINTLLNTSDVIGLDMPLTMSPSEAAQLINEKINSFDDDKDWIIFADMGSLAQLDKQLVTKNENQIFVIESTNLLIILESVRQAIFSFVSSKQIVADIAQMNDELNHKLQVRVKNYLETEMNRVIYTVCASGEGVALFLEQIIGEFLRSNHIYDVQLIPLSGSQKDIEHIIRLTSKDKESVAIIGSIQLEQLAIPYISLDEILLKQGFDLLLNLLGKHVPDSDKTMLSIDKATRAITFRLCSEALDKYLMYIAPEKIHSLLIKQIEQMEEFFEVRLSNETLMKLFIHIGCMLERLMFENKTLTAAKEDQLAMKKTYPTHSEKIKRSFDEIEESFNITLPPSELFYIHEILLTDVAFD